MLIKHTSSKPVFYPWLSTYGRELQPGEELEVSDQLSFDAGFKAAKDRGDIIILSYGDEPDSPVVQDEVEEIVEAAVEEAVEESVSAALDENYVVDRIPVEQDGQTDFTLSNIPKNPSEATCVICALQHRWLIDYNISGKDFHWNNVGFELDTEDIVEVRYFK